MSLRSWDFTDPQAEGSTCCWLPVLPVLSGVSCSGSLAVPCKGWRQEICTSEVCGAVRAHWVAGSVSSHCGSGLALQQGWPHLYPRAEEEPAPIWKKSWGVFLRLFFHFSWSFLNKKLWFFFPVPFCFEWLAIFVGTCLKEKDILIGRGSVLTISSCAIMSNAFHLVQM